MSLHNRNIRILLSVISGILLSLSWLKFPGWFLFFALIPILWVEDFFVRNKNNYRSVSVWGYSFLAFFIWNGLTTWWIMYASFAGAVAAILLNSFVMSLVWWLAHYARRHFKNSLGYVTLIVFWLAFEYLHYNWDIEWPWLTLGNGFANNVKLVQWYEYTGIFGGSIWILVVNILLFKICKAYIENKSVFNTLYKKLIVLFAIIFIPIIFSLLIYYTYSEEEDGKNIVIVQPNIDPYNESFDLVASNNKLYKFIGLAESAITPETDLIVGPETVFDQNWNEELLEFNSQYNELRDLAMGFPGTDLLLGASTYKIFQSGEEISLTARTASDGTIYDLYNTAVFINNSGDNQIYHKSILVSGVEKMPYMKYLKFLGNFIIDLGGTSGSLGSQDEPENFIASDGTLIATAICYESIFGEYLTEFVKKGAQYIFIITNDGWWRNTPGYKQHMSFARLRAIETRRSIARSANTGISCFINQRGDVLQKSGWWEEAVLTGRINANDTLTFYVKYGDYIGRISSFLAILIMLYLLSLFFIKNKKIRINSVL